MMKMFNKNTSKKTIYIQKEKTHFPSGMCVRAEQFSYLIKGNIRYKINTPRVLASWKFLQIAEATEEALEDYKVAGTLGFRDGTVIKDISTAKMYFISDTKKRLIVSPDVFLRFGISKDSAVDVSSQECALHLEGDELK